MKKAISQSGRATLELAAILTGLIAMTLGLLFIVGLSLSDNRTLQETPADSEQDTRNDGEAEAAAGEVRAWNYGPTTVAGDTAALPSPSKETPAWRTYPGRLDHTATGLRSGEYSAGQEDGAYQSLWMNPSGFDSELRSDFSPPLTNGYNAARLYHDSDNSIGPVYEFDESGLLLSGAHMDDNAIRRRTRQAARDTFHPWFGVKINDRQPAGSPANRGSMPNAKAADGEEAQEENGE